LNYSNISAIVLDLDGTLLNSKKEVSNRNYKAVLECMNKGYPIIFATARPPRAVKWFLPEELLNVGYFVYYNGAFIINERKSLEYHVFIESEITTEIVDYCATQYPNCILGIEYKDEWFCYKEVDYSTTMNVKDTPKVIEIEELKKLNATKILITELDEVTSLISRFGSLVNILITDGGQLIQIMPKLASKESAIKMICENEKIELTRVLAFGDDFNDLGLFQICGFPIAMGNSIQELKEIALEITETNDNDGVAIVLERLPPTERIFPI
jgi:Cof subfamily protein (haloacid dehalogenase superfamily)